MTQPGQTKIRISAEGVLVRAQTIVRFGEFGFDPEAGLLTQGNHRLSVAPKALAVLAVLVRNAGSVVSKDDLLSSVWPEGPVEEGNLAVHIFSLRRTLGGSLIETVPRRGYRFAAPVFPGQPQEPCSIAEHCLQQQTIGGCRRAENLYRKCLAADPGSVKGRVGLANAMMFRAVLGGLSREDVAPRAEALLQAASAIDPDNAGVHLSRSRLLHLFQWQWQQAREQLERAFETAGPGDLQPVIGAWRGFDLVARGELQQGIRELSRSSEACPLSTFIWRMLADAHFLARDFTGCVAVGREALELHPGCCLLYRSLGRGLTALGEYDDARSQFRRANVVSGSPQIAVLADIAYLDAVAGNRDHAAAFLGRQQRQPGHVSRVLMAEICSAMGNKERALEYLEEACLTRDWAIAGAMQNIRFDPIRNSARFRSVLARAGM